MEGSYHGHHDAVLFSVVPESDVLDLRMHPGGDAADASGSAYTTQPTSKGVPRSMWHDTIIVPFNDASAVEEVFTEHGDEIGALILEPVMMNIGIVVPHPGYLDALRALCDRFGVVLIFDEVKCGGTIAAAGRPSATASNRTWRVWRRRSGAGSPSARSAARRPSWTWYEGGRPAGDVQRQPRLVCGRAGGTHGGPHPGRVRGVRPAGNHAGGRLREGHTEHDIPGHAVDLGAKGCVSYRPSH